MDGQHSTPPRRRDRHVAMATTLGLIASLLVAAPARSTAGEPADATGRPEVTAATPVVEGAPVPVRPRAADPLGAADPPAAVRWPQPGAAEVAVPAVERMGSGTAGVTEVLSPPDLAPAAPGVRAGDLPVWIRPAREPMLAGEVAGSTVRVRVHDRGLARRAGVHGVLLSVNSAAAATTSRRVRLTLDYAGFAHAFGGAYGSRLRLVRLPGCVLATPGRAGCRTPTPVATHNDTEAQRLTAGVRVTPADPGLVLRGSGRGSQARPVAAGATVLAATAGESSEKGDYQATKLSPSATWSVATHTGSFTWSYPMRVPPVPGRLTPQLAISYSSGSVDGRTSNTNSQSSWIGEGFDLWPGFIERSYKACAEDGAPKDEWGNEPGDRCWEHDNATISFNGLAGELVPAGSNTWRLRHDDGTRIEKLTGKSNGDNNGEYWKLTTTDGVRYFFGMNRLPGWSSGDPVTRSAWNVPVFGNESGEPCHDDTFGSSWCRQAWRWNLDYVVDPHGNAVTYFYDRETNRYGRNLEPKHDTAYHRGGYLKRIEYGHRAGSLFGSDAPARVVFDVAERCIPTDGFDCAPSKIDDHAHRWADVPWDLHCAAGTKCGVDHGAVAPTFWSRKRLTKVTTQIARTGGNGYRNVDSWRLAHRWGEADIDRSLLPTSIQHTGHAGAGAVTLPKVTFNHIQLTNRLDKVGDDIAPFIKYRLGAIFDESGGQIDINYSGPQCSLGALPTPHTNTKRCFPVYWQPPGEEDPVRDWFHKYVVTSVVVSDRTARSPDMLTTYEYLGGAAWHYDDDDGLVRKKYKTWSQWRGYGHVRVRTGGWNDLRSQTDHRYFRGMDGDRAGPDGGRKDVTVSDGEGGTHRDHRALDGFQLKETVRNGPGGPVVTKTVTTPWRHQTASRTRSWGTVTANLTGVATSRTWTALGGGQWRKTLTETTYGNRAGLPTRINDRGDTATGADNQCTRISYAQDPDAWLLDFPSRTETVAVGCGGTPDRSEDVISDVRTYYDGKGFGAAPVRGNVTRTEEIASHDGTTAQYITGQATTYDSYGRETSVTDAAGHQTTTTYTDTRGLTTGTKVTGPAVQPGDAGSAHVASRTLDPAWGLPVVEIDADGGRTQLAYDALGRLRKVWLPNRTTNQTPNHEFTYRIQPDTIVAVGTKILTAQGGQTVSYELFDGLLRPRQTQRPGPDGGRLITDTFHDSRGNIVREYDTYYATGAPTTNLFGVANPGSVESQTAYSYDGLGRQTVKRFLVGNGDTQERWRTTTSYSGDRVSVDPPAGGTPTTTIKDARDQVMELRQYHGDAPSGEYDATTYTHTPAGKLGTVTDPAGNTWRYTYDLRGRKIRASDPDSGTTTYTYDDLDRRASTTDARGERIFHSYDALGRKLETRKDSADGPLLAEWEYDTLRKGALTSSTRHAAGHAYTSRVVAYDTLGRPIRTTITIPEAEGALAGSYTFNTRYNLDGTVQSTSFPAAGGLPAEAISYGYDELKRPTTTGSNLASYVTASRYSLTGQPQQHELSTGGPKAWLTYSYEYGTRRLALSRVDREGVTGVDRHATYQHDDAGNITAIADVSRSGTDTQCFDHDYVHRLVEAWTQATTDCGSSPSASLVGGPAPYWTSYRYDATGNRTREVQHGTGGGADTVRAYSYPAAGQAQPHTLSAVAQTGGAGDRTEQYGYDPAGNTTTRTIGDVSQTLAWDAEGHLATVTEAGETTSFIYTTKGERLVRREPGATTLYLPSTELRLDRTSGQVTARRYYAHNGQTVAVRTTNTGVSFLAGDHHGTAQLAIDASTQELTRRRFTPFGRPRGDTSGQWPDEKGFVGGTLDASTGLTHLGAREYDPATGRFISVDPIIDTGDPQQMHGYAYANNSPVTYTDPDGLRPLCGGREPACPVDKSRKSKRRSSKSYPNACVIAPLTCLAAEQGEKQRARSSGGYSSCHGWECAAIRSHQAKSKRVNIVNRAAMGLARVGINLVLPFTTVASAIFQARALYMRYLYKRLFEEVWEASGWTKAKARWGVELVRQINLVRRMAMLGKLAGRANVVFAGGFAAVGQWRRDAGRGDLDNWERGGRALVSGGAVATGAAVGAGVGALVGSVVPVAGTAVGAAVGAGLGAGLGFAGQRVANWANNNGAGEAIGGWMRDVAEPQLRSMDPHPSA